MTTPPNTPPDASQIAQEIREGQRPNHWWQNYSNTKITALLNAFDAQAREIAELREALEPFAEKTAVHFVEGGLFSNASDGLALMWMSATEQVDQFTVGDLRRARSALRAKENPNG